MTQREIENLLECHGIGYIITPNKHYGLKIAVSADDYCFACEAFNHTGFLITTI